KVLAMARLPALLIQKSKAITLELTGTPSQIVMGNVTLSNPASPSAKTASQLFTVPVVVTDAAGNVIMTSPAAAPLSVRVYGPTGLVTPLGGDEFTYSGGFFANPMVAVATSGTASMTAH